ncbi:Toxin co-regulated pilus biosynthesis protein Q [Cupriavidus sp. YR651]|uniref:toxin co-regulated pilus biosynthesis Q family protein n=1 Tax=Cupriavidus sp. YR651 TaxID=1855315 RepID=UPI000887F35A|nr:toxin co-regulated pilus biosynthesis Q family protein [Cupriavidus sp. YR651]SDD57294.1 Toxin co-regulated pilus biosynthesis protein Q [Cupriavidus sp. YR651]
MHQPRSMSRMCRALLSGAAALAVCAHAAVPGTSPFGAEAPGNFEPTKPLAGGGWQLLSERRAAAQSKASDVAITAVPASAQAAIAPVAVTSAAVAPVVAAPAASTTAPAGARDWTVSAADVNYRLLIEKWARDAGWTAAPWEMDQDVEIGGGDSFTGDFKTAVRRVLSATEMTDYSLKPCFYSNNYVRVVKLTTKCDPSK